MSTSQAEKKMTMKLLVNKKTNKLIYAEATKDCIDFLFQMLVLPLGSTMKLLLNDDTALNGGSLGSLYKSVEELESEYLIDPNVSRECLLNPSVPKNVASRVSDWFINLNPYPKSPKTLYTCKTAHFPLPMSDVVGLKCPHCSLSFDRPLQYIGPEAKTGEGYVKGLLRFMITDDLVVKPLTSISSFALLVELEIEDLSSIEEKEVTLDTAKGMALLKASMTSKTVLTDTFLVNQETTDPLVV